LDMTYDRYRKERRSELARWREAYEGRQKKGKTNDVGD
jgi:hypothetical protein